MRKNINTWFSVIMAILITAFLVILSAWVLLLVLQEQKNTRLVYNSIATYEWALWANELALLKIKNHWEWFEDSVENIDDDSKLLGKNNNITNKDVQITYNIDNYSKEYEWTIKSWEYEIIPLYFDEWEYIQTNSKNPNIWSSDIKKTQDIKFTSSDNITWNIIWNNDDWETFWINWKWWKNSVVNSESIWNIKTSEDDSTNLWDWARKQDYWEIKISDFLSQYKQNYLIIYNPLENEVSYKLESDTWFANPRLKVIWSWKTGDFRQNIEFTENKNRYLDLIKYSLYNK